MAKIEKTRIECIEESEDGRSAKFVVEPLERGDGKTIGNSLRRILLSQINGAAATSIAIDGVRHEFSTIPGVKEDVTEIVLNLKSVNFKLHTDATEVVLQHNGAGVVTAADIDCNSDVEVLNPEQHIATLNDDAKLYIRIMVKAGRGWCVADKNKDATMPVGTIAIDSIFSPIEKVNDVVENTLVGNSTDYEKLTLEIKTNGAIKPADALKEAASILVKKLSLFTNGNDDVADYGNEPQIEAISKDIYDIKIEDLDLDVRPLNCLKSVGIVTVGGILQHSPEEIKKIHNLGKTSFADIVEKLAKVGVVYGSVEESNG